jgi:hypothetical protein
MIPRLPPALLLAMAAPLAAGAGAPAPDTLADGTQWAQLTIHERLIIRIPRMPPASRMAMRAPAPVEWRERRGPRCLTMTSLTGAAIGRDGEVDLIVEGSQRVRARLDSQCPTLDFYSGMYLKPTGDGKICARRDAIRTRSGGRCAIAQFRKLVPAR